MLTLNVPVGKTVSIGQTNSIKLIGVSSDEAGRDVAVIRNHQYDGSHPETYRMKAGTSQQVADNVIIYFNRILTGRGSIARFSFDAPRDIYIRNNWGRPKQVNFRKLTHEELIEYTRTWGKSSLEDELANRLEECCSGL